MEIDRALESQHAEVQAFYASVGYTGVVQAGEEILVARSEAGIIGAVRLREEEGRLVLRGMYVSESRRGSGVGSALLSALSASIGPRECWCVPYSHLQAFYGRAGFAEAEEGSVPPFLVARCLAYREGGQDVIITRRPTGWAATGRDG